MSKFQKSCITHNFDKEKHTCTKCGGIQASYIEDIRNEEKRKIIAALELAKEMGFIPKDVKL